MKKISINLIYILIWVLFFALLLCLIPIPHKIKKAQDGIKWDGDDAEYQEERKVVISGVYHDYLLEFLKEDYFEGQISIDDTFYTENAGTWHIRFFSSKKKNVKTGELSYYAGDGKMLYGTIYMEKGFDRGIIQLETKEGESQKYLSFPAGNRAEALIIAEEMIADNIIKE